MGKISIMEVLHMRKILIIFIPILCLAIASIFSISFGNEEIKGNENNSDDVNFEIRNCYY